MSGKLVLVTGVTGFIAGHVAHGFLKAGYRVRGTARGDKAKQLTETIKVEGLEFARVDDIATDDLSEVLKGVYAIIHVASPLPGRTDVDDTLNSAIDGTNHILEAATKAGIEKLVITSSFGALFDASLVPGFHGLTFTYKDWGVVSREEARAKAEDPYYVYFASKILAEKAIWEYAEKHPELDIATVLPGFVFGPYADHFPLPKESQLGTNGFIHGLVSGAPLTPIPPFIADVRDVAKAHVLALGVNRKPLGEKRYIANGGNFTWRQAAAHLNKVRPEIKTAAIDAFADLPGPASKLDTTHTTQQLNFGTWIPTEKTIEDAADALVALKKTW
ncbi:putative uncharacterized oxidoreductase [Termitomyces sp. T112]|nr:hypothetical protein C0989_001496 [Termitomyces sp. Mn162]KAG5726545.1 putative uncharacterized oxidoreductase [Termitomyces sp. T112]KAH0579366.1 hypothetical protein H2248_003505 [Termitomyces sp. 'cryptogamus']KAH0579367.1 hypothetical protein H2248_003505 [Termitomyces sp. 'cryptogamus']